VYYTIFIIKNQAKSKKLTIRERSLRLALLAQGRQDSGRDSVFFLAFYDKAGHNFVGISGTNNFDTTRRIA